MDYAYICRQGDNEELRYSIRSVVKNTSKSNIFVFGQAPKWYRGNLEIVKEVGTKYSRARNNLAAISRSENVSENFILMNDDFFIMQKMTVPEIWHGGLLIDRINERKKIDPDEPYVSQLIQTYKTLRYLGVENPINYELHTPLQMTKTGLGEALKQPGLWRSIYGNLNEIGGQYHDDVKVYHDGYRLKSYDWKNKSKFLSTMDTAFDKEVGDMIRDKFTKKTKYES